VPLCVVVARTPYDARVKKLQADADSILDLIMEARSNIATCEKPPGSFLKELCLVGKLTHTVLKAQEYKREVLPSYWDLHNNAPSVIPQDAEACTNGRIKSVQFDADVAFNNLVRCL